MTGLGYRWKSAKKLVGSTGQVGLKSLNFPSTIISTAAEFVQV
jgi:hypothetical protein